MDGWVRLCLGRDYRGVASSFDARVFFLVRRCV
jgi:hypothetical protein